MASVQVNTNGQTLTVNASVSHWTTAALAVTASGTNDVESTTTTTITSNYTMHFSNSATTAVVTVKQRDGSTILSQTFDVSPGTGPRVLNPQPDPYQTSSDLQGRLALAPTGALAETTPRNTGTITNTAGIVSGTMRCVAIYLPKDTTVTSITFISATTAAVAPTNWWFALYDSALALLGQTADQTSTAWAANTAKTVALATPVVTTYSGLHYLGLMIAAGTPISWYTSATNVNLQTIAPVTHGSSTTGLTTTAPNPALALTAETGNPYAYVS
jgi:hypothetical protein